jgi:hypothetical protein
VNTIRLESELDGPAADALAGTLLPRAAADRILQPSDGPTTVLRPDGSRLLVYLPRILPSSACKTAYPALRTAAGETDNRGLAGGVIPRGATVVKGNEPIGRRTRTRWRALKGDGTVSGSSRAIPVNSGVVGYFDRSSRFPYCRMTAFGLAHPDRLAAALPLVRACDRAFAAAVPDRHAAQLAAARAGSPDFVLPGTCFSTITVNRNWQTAVHQDVGDLAAGFGVMTAFRAGDYRGGELCFPRQRVAVDLHTGDLLLADVHQWHGNFPLAGAPGTFERLSLVLYYRERIADCGSAAEELARVRGRRRGQALNGRGQALNGRGP